MTWNRFVLICACFLALGTSLEMHSQSLQSVQTDSQYTPTINRPMTSLQNSASPLPSLNPERVQDDSDLTSARLPGRTLRNPLNPPVELPLTEFQQTVLDSTGKKLPIFGDNLFQSAPSTFAPVDNVPVTPDYVIGPGDELRLLIWGQVNQRGSFMVDRTGSISLPEVGTIHVAGLQFSQLSDFLKSQLGRVYRNFDLNVNLGQLRSIQVFVVGQARQPGSYTVGSLSTLLNALFASGGPLPQGSLRDIQLRRGDKTVSDFDLYDLLLHGDKSKDVRLNSGDVIFIPEAGPQVAVMGSVTTPAIYELRGEKSFKQVVALAGKETVVAAGTQLRVERIYKHSERDMINVDLNDVNSAHAENGDIVIVNSIIDRFNNAVILRGNVANPGRYAWHSGMRISELIPSKDALVTRSYYQRQNRLGYIPQAKPVPTQQVPGYTLQGQPMLGYPVQSYTPQGQPIPVEPEPQPASTVSDYSMPNREGALGIQSGVVADGAAQRSTGSTTGGGKSAGAALISNDSNFTAANDLIMSAPDIDWTYAVIQRQDANDLTTTLLPFNLGKVVLDKDPSQDLELLPGDVVTIFSKADVRVPNSQQTKFVRLEGEFVAAGVYSVLPGETLRQLLVRSGGLTADADLYASEFTRQSVRRLQHQRILQYADALEAQITAQTSARESSALTDRDAAAAQAAAVEARADLAHLREAQPTGRIVLELQPDAKDLSSIPDIALEDGDRLVVPKTPSTVSVQGQVYNANAFLYEPNKRVSDYIKLSGGPDRSADKKREFILRADGSVVSYQLASAGTFGSNGFDHVKTLPGDTIIVPPALEKGALMRELLNISTILQGFGIGAAAIEVLK